MGHKQKMKRQKLGKSPEGKKNLNGQLTEWGIIGEKLSARLILSQKRNQKIVPGKNKEDDANTENRKGQRVRMKVEGAINLTAKKKKSTERPKIKKGGGEKKLGERPLGKLNSIRPMKWHRKNVPKTAAKKKIIERATAHEKPFW